MAIYTNNQLQRSQMIPRNPNLEPELQAPIGGYMINSDTEMGSLEIGRTLQLYASQPITADPFNPAATEFINPNTKQIEMCSSTLTTKGERLWLVCVNAIEVIQIDPAGADGIPRLSASEILNANYPRYSTLQAQVNWMDGSANSHIIKYDISGGTKFKVFGRNVQVFILAPDNTQIITSSQTTSINLTGITLNEMVSASIKPLTIGVDNLDILKYTWNECVVAGEDSFVEIPPGARKVRIYNASLGNTPREVYFWLSNDPTYGKLIGIIDFNNNQTNLLEIPGEATHILIPSDVALDSCYSLVFILDP